ncbi:hypothetical protein SEVIR_5G009666v4 [Setaria viridis]
MRLVGLNFQITAKTNRTAYWTEFSDNRKDIRFHLLLQQDKNAKTRSVYRHAPSITRISKTANSSLNLKLTMQCSNFFLPVKDPFKRILCNGIEAQFCLLCNSLKQMLPASVFAFQFSALDQQEFTDAIKKKSTWLHSWKQLSKRQNRLRSR